MPSTDKITIVKILLKIAHDNYFYCSMTITWAETEGEQGAENRHGVGRAGLPGLFSIQSRGSGFRKILDIVDIYLFF